MSTFLELSLCRNGSPIQSIHALERHFCFSEEDKGGGEASDDVKSESPANISGMAFEL
jgi:hypothetical protein